MEFGIAVPSAADSWKIVQRAEELGFTHAWFYDTQMLCADCFVAMAAAAVKTRRIRLGTGVLIPSNRIAPVTAGAFASLNALAPGRIDFGVGTGFTGRRAMGFGAMTLAAMEDYIHQVMALLANETVDFAMEGERHPIRFLNPELGLINTRDPVGLHVSAYGPRSRALTAKLGAGWLNFIGVPSSGITELAAMQAAWTKAGHSAGTLQATAFALGCILAEGEAFDSPARSPRPDRARPCCCIARPTKRWPACPTRPKCPMRSLRRSPAMSRWRAISNRRRRAICRTTAAICCS